MFTIGVSAPMICTDGHLYGHQTVHGFEFTNEFSGSTPATSTSPTCIVLKLLNNFDTLVNKPQVFVNCETITN